MNSEMKAKDGLEEGIRRGRFVEVPPRYSPGGKPLKTFPSWLALGENRTRVSRMRGAWANHRTTTLGNSEFRYISWVLKNNIIKEHYLGTIFIYKNTLLKNTVEWHTIKKFKDFWGFSRVREKKKIFVKSLKGSL